MGMQPLLPKGAQPIPQFLAHVCCGQTAGWIKMPLGREVDLGPVDIVLDGNPAPPPPKGHRPHFLAYVCCGQRDGWMKMALCKEVCLGPGQIVLDEDPASSPPRKGHSSPPLFSPCPLWPNCRPSQLLLTACF